MYRDVLISQVKEEYARLADLSTKETFVDQVNASLNQEVYYEKLLSRVIHKIEAGVFDHCHTGKEVVQAVANDRSLLE